MERGQIRPSLARRRRGSIVNAAVPGDTRRRDRLLDALSC